MRVDLEGPFSYAKGGLDSQVQVRLRRRIEEDGKRATSTLPVELRALPSSSVRPPSSPCHALAISLVLITHRSWPVRDAVGCTSSMRTKTIK